MKSALSTLIFLALFAVYLLIEVVAAMAVYMYLNLNHINTFGQLIGLSAKLLAILTDRLEQLYPELANQAFATILGEMGPKSILLLLLGLGVSAVTRFLVWSTGKVMDWIKGLFTRRSKTAAPAPATTPAEPEATEGAAAS